MDETQTPRHVGSNERGILVDALGDSPETIISVHLLVRGLCEAYVAGDPERFRGLIVQGHQTPGEPTGFGSDAPTLWELLKAARGWWCVNVSESCAPRLGAIVEEETGRAVRYYGDVYHTLTRPVSPFYHEAVRLLDLTDLEILGSAAPEVRGGGWGSARRMIDEGIAAAGGRRRTPCRCRLHLRAQPQARRHSSENPRGMARVRTRDGGGLPSRKGGARAGTGACLELRRGQPRISARGT